MSPSHFIPWKRRDRGVVTKKCLGSIGDLLPGFVEKIAEAGSNFFFANLIRDGMVNLRLSGTSRPPRRFELPTTPIRRRVETFVFDSVRRNSNQDVAANCLSVDRHQTSYGRRYLASHTPNVTMTSDPRYSDQK